MNISQLQQGKDTFYQLVFYIHQIVIPSVDGWAVSWFHSNFKPESFAIFCLL